jgi:hypothetical protein
VRNSIIICIHENNKNILFENKSIYLVNPSEILFSNQRILSNNYTVVNYNPNMKFCIPLDISLTFKEPEREKTYINKIYPNINYIIKSGEITLVSYTFSVFIDRERTKEMNRVLRYEKFIEVGFEYKPFAENAIENIYLIQNNFCFQEFEQHFSK